MYIYFKKLNILPIPESAVPGYAVRRAWLITREVESNGQDT
jgi:hypothetical protein